MLYTLPLWIGLYRQPEEWPWLYVFLIFVQGFFVVTNAGKSLGLDALVAREPFGPVAGDGALARVYRKATFWLFTLPSEPCAAYEWNAKVIPQSKSHRSPAMT